MSMCEAEAIKRHSAACADSLSTTYEMFFETLTLFCLLISLSSQQTCPSYEAGSIGTAGSRRNPQTNRVYINTDNRVSCAGIVYGWRFCTYSNSANDHVQVSMYRDIIGDDDEGGYQLVDGSLYSLTVNNTIDSYTCLDRYLEYHNYFTVEQGDMIASCWNDDDNQIKMLSRSSRRLVSGGECSQGIIDEVSYPYRKVLLSAYINVDECTYGEHRCHQNATCYDVIGAEDSYNCTCNNGHTGDGFLCVVENVTDDAKNSTNCTTTNTGSCVDIVDDGKNSTNCTTNSGSCVVEDDSETTGNNDGKADVGTVVTIVITLLLSLLVLITLVVLLGFFIHRKRSQQRQLALDVTNIGNELYLKHNEVSFNTTTNGAVAYEVPLNSLQKKNAFELESCELTYEPSTEGNIYETPDTLDGHVYETTCYELPSEYAAIYEQAVSGGNIYECASPYECPAKDESSLYEQITSYHIKVINRKDIQFTSHLGSGQFGSVSKAELKTKNGEQDVAVKTLTDSANTVKFLQEAAIMAQFKHPNILTLHGVVSVGDPKMIVVELMCNGDLKECVTNMRPDPGQLVADNVPKQLLNFSKQVALGLHYLSCRGFIHRDLAARNVLVSNMLCKIADFGMSRDLANDDIYVSNGGMIPVRWTAPEAINQKRYSTASDVWSYGCVLYEIWSLGHKPFEAVQVKQVPQLVKSGYRLPPPPGCPKKIYKLMIDTWHPDVASRPEPKDVLRGLIGNVNEVMEISTEDVPVGSQATVLGAPLNTANHLYTQLQNSYK